MERILQLLRDVVSYFGIHYGIISIHIQDGRIVHIEKKETLVINSKQKISEKDLINT